MNFFTFTKLGRVMLLAAVLAVGLTGCGDDNGANSGGANETVTIGGVKWMKKNLNVPMCDEMDADCGSRCYGGDAANCKKYGRLYTWEAAEKACQSVEMRLPSYDDWMALAQEAGGGSTAGKKLKSKSGWFDPDGKPANGTDNYGFSALPGGSLGITLSEEGAGNVGFWWTSTSIPGSRGTYYAYAWVISYSDNTRFHDEGNKIGGAMVSVRCIKD